MTMNDPAVTFDLTGLMRAHRVTIRELAGRMEIPMTRVRAVRALDRVSYCSLCDFYQAVTGVNIFDRAAFDAMYF